MHRGRVDEDAVVIEVDGHAVSARRGDSVAVALLTAGISTLRHSPRLRAPRGIFCFMGSCQECLVVINGKRRLACEVLIESGMSVRTTELP
ncbi:MAG: (2Fe-2S)-binding protein [Arenicellales bacterium]|jgi:predicted molibdopterin-dependent oxidoreductase YjgC|nr:(2Fe-2S)-binding protein [Arenicellales bacterium]|tara:strand:- start:408 stop:680 length:273 start_codon:yes stop_codon:yes gene_type:complete